MEPKQVERIQVRDDKFLDLLLANLGELQESQEETKSEKEPDHPGIKAWLFTTSAIPY